MKAILHLPLILFSINAVAQNLTADEKIKVLQTTKQSVELIDFVVQGDYTFPELNQANKLKTKGVKDETIIYVLKTHAVLTETEINDLYDYQQQGLPTSVINKTIDEKPKSVDSYKEKAKKYPPKTKYTIEDKSILEKDTVKYNETLAVDLNKEEIVEGIKTWLGKYKSKKSNIQSINDTTMSVVGIFFLKPKYDWAKDMIANEPTVKFNIYVTCSDGYYTYKINDIKVSYYYGREPSNIIEGPIENMPTSAVRGAFKDQIHEKIVERINDINSFLPSK